MTLVRGSFSGMKFSSSGGRTVNISQRPLELMLFMRMYADAYRKMLGTVSLSSLTAIVNPYVLLFAAISRNGSLDGLSAANFHLVTSARDLLGDVAEVLDLGLHPPVPFVLLQQLMLVEESALPSVAFSSMEHCTAHPE